MKASYIILFIIFSIAVLILFFNENNDDIECVASRATLYVSRTCGFCHEQIKILDKDYFKIIYCEEEIEICREMNITGTPTWIINGERYLGKRSLENLKEISGC